MEGIPEKALWVASNYFPYPAVWDELKRVYEISSMSERCTIALVNALLIRVCYDATIPTIQNNTNVVVSLSRLFHAVRDHLEVREARIKTGFLFGLLSVRPAFNRTSEAVDKAKNALNQAIHEAWIEAAGRDPRDDEAYHAEFRALTGFAP